MDGGIVAQKGFYIQAIVTLLAAFNNENWDELEAEIESENDKIDYGFYKDGKLSIVAQVKSTQNSFNKSEIKQWLNDLHSDKPDAEQYVMVLAGNISPETANYINNIDREQITGFKSDQLISIKLYHSNLNELLKIYHHDLYKFISSSGVMDSIPLHILEDVAALLEREFQSLVLSRARWTHNDILDFLSKKLRILINEVESKLTPISIIAFDRGSKNAQMETAPENCLDLKDLFEDRILKKDLSWESVFQRLSNFIDNLDTTIHYKLNIEASYTISFALGLMMDGKSGLTFHLVQKTQFKGAQIWDINPTVSIPDINCNCIVEYHGDNKTVAVVIGLTRNILSDVQNYLCDKNITVGKILYFTPSQSASQFYVQNGDHARFLAQYIATEIKKHNADKILLFPACPNSVCFMLGQLSRSFKNITMYEYDFNNIFKGSYYYTYTFNRR